MQENKRKKLREFFTTFLGFCGAGILLDSVPWFLSLPFGVFTIGMATIGVMVAVYEI